MIQGPNQSTNKVANMGQPIGTTNDAMNNKTPAISKNKPVPQPKNDVIEFVDIGLSMFN